MTHVVVIRPCYELATMYGWFWTNELYTKHALKLGYDVIDLAIKNATQAKLIESLNKDPVLIAGVAHGNKDIIVGQDHTLLFKVGDPNTEKIVKGRHVWMLSCLAGQRLLPWMVEKGAITTMGYKEEFIFCLNTYPNNIAKPFFDSHFTGLQKFLEGKTAKEAFEAALAKFDEYLNDPNVPEKIKPYLLHDRNCAVLFGDPNAKIGSGGGDMVKTAHVVVYLEKITEETGRIIFEVLEKDTKKPVKDAKVTLTWDNNSKATYTNENGIAIFENMEIREYDYKVEKSGYKPAEGKITPDMFQ